MLLKFEVGDGFGWDGSVADLLLDITEKRGKKIRHDPVDIQPNHH